MEEMRCKECGEVVAAGMTECPNCGCPVQKGETVNPDNNTVGAFTTDAIPASSFSKPADTVFAGGAMLKQQPVKPKKHFMPLISLVLGVVILIMGIFVVTKKSDCDIYSARTYSVSSLSFGADFYTEIYNASDTIVDELNGVNMGIGTLSESMNSIADITLLSFSCRNLQS